MSGPNHINTPPPDTEEHTVMRDLPVPIEPDRVHSMATELADKVTEKDALQAEYRDVKADYNKRLKDLSGVVNDLARKVHAESEDRPVECTVFKDFVHNNVKITRLDTGEVLDDRIMTVEEMQRSFVDERPDDNVVDGHFAEVGEDDEADEFAEAADAAEEAPDCACTPFKEAPQEELTAGDAWPCETHGPMWVGPEHQIEPRPDF